MCYHDDYACDTYIETDKERAEREAREEQAELDRIMRQRKCLHARYVEIGHGAWLEISGLFWQYVTVYCPDCEHEDEIELSAWHARIGRVTV